MDPTIRLEHDRPVPGRPLAVRALLTLTGSPPSTEDRAPLNLSLVLDRSGSMHGAKMEAAREAAALAVQRLWPNDVVSVVAYDHEVTVVVPPGPGSAQGQVSHLLRSIEARGSTNLSGGWLKARELVAAGADPDGVNRILLLTDGLANQGVTDPDALLGMCRQAAADGVTTTTIGFGEDFDEALLAGMADAGGGATYYIEEADQAPGVFEEELEGLLSLCAQNVAAVVDVTPAVRIAAVRHAYPSSESVAGLRLEMGDLYAREPKRLLLELVVDAVPSAAEGDAELATVTLEADALEVGGGMARKRIDLAIRLNVDGGARVDPEVRREALLLDAADARRRAMEQQDRGDYDGAASALREAGVKLREAAPEFGERIAEEAEDLERMSAVLAEQPAAPADRKYMAQRAYDASRSRGASYRKISRRKREE